MIYPLLYVSAIVCANLSVAYFGPVSTPINAFFLIGLDMAIRDKLHESISSKYRFYYIGSLILVAGLISHLLNPATGIIAIASLIAFISSAFVDTIIYHWLIEKEYFVKCNVSNVGGAAVDSLVFPMIAFGSFMPFVVVGQFVAKVLGGFVWSLILNRFFK